MATFGALIENLRREVRSYLQEGAATAKQVSYLLALSKKNKNWPAISASFGILFAPHEKAQLEYALNNMSSYKASQLISALVNGSSSSSSYSKGSGYASYGTSKSTGSPSPAKWTEPAKQQQMPTSLAKYTFTTKPKKYRSPYDGMPAPAGVSNDAWDLFAEVDAINDVWKSFSKLHAWPKPPTLGQIVAMDKAEIAKLGKLVHSAIMDVTNDGEIWAED